ncbi:hypothetical protein JNUCC23_02885 [Peribacillus sp. JNUCC 23]
MMQSQAFLPDFLNILFKNGRMLYESFILNEVNLSKAMSISYEELKEEHIQDYQHLFKRVEFSLEEVLDTDEGVKKYSTSDLEMVELLPALPSTW